MNHEPEFIDKCAEGLVLDNNQGEVCTCHTRRLFTDIYDAFMEKVLEKIQKIKRGNPLDTDTMVGTQASNEQFEKIINTSISVSQKGWESLVMRKSSYLALMQLLHSADYLEGENHMRVFRKRFLVR